MNENNKLTPAQERELIDTFNTFLQDGTYTQLLVTYNDMLTAYLMTERCARATPKRREALEYNLYSFHLLLSVPTS